MKTQDYTCVLCKHKRKLMSTQLYRYTSVFYFQQSCRVSYKLQRTFLQICWKVIKSIFVPVSGRNKRGVDGGKWGLAENTEIPAVIIKRKKKTIFTCITEFSHRTSASLFYDLPHYQAVQHSREINSQIRNLIPA